MGTTPSDFPQLNPDDWHPDLIRLADALRARTDRVAERLALVEARPPFRLRPAASWFAGIALVAMLLFPPWQRAYRDGNVKITMAAGYGPIFSPPKGADEVDMGRLFLSGLALGVVTLAVNALSRPPS